MISIAILVLSSNVYSQVKSEKTPLTKLRSEEMNKKCEPNSDTRYDRVEVLKKLGNTLNKTAIDYHNAIYSIKKTSKNPKFVNNNERPIGFFVFDLTDTSNKGTPLGECMEFKNNHIYHFALINIPFSFSHIVVLENGNLKIFKAVNCKDGDSLEDVISYLNQMLKDTGNKNEILNRVRNYREYGIYSTVDDDSLRCQ
jgi:hypothetical protein